MNAQQREIVRWAVVAVPLSVVVYLGLVWALGAPRIMLLVPVGYTLFMGRLWQRAGRPQQEGPMTTSEPLVEPEETKELPSAMALEVAGHILELTGGETDAKLHVDVAKILDQLIDESERRGRDRLVPTTAEAVIESCRLHDVLDDIARGRITDPRAAARAAIRPSGKRVEDPGE